jgi:hypothetical protein
LRIAWERRGTYLSDEQETRLTRNSCQGRELSVGEWSLCADHPLLNTCTGYVAHPFSKEMVFTLAFHRCDPSFPAYLPGSGSLQEGQGCLEHGGFSVCSPRAIRLLSRCDPCSFRPPLLYSSCTDKIRSAHRIISFVSLHLQALHRDRQGKVDVQVGSTHIRKLSCCPDVIVSLSEELEVHSYAFCCPRCFWT